MALTRYKILRRTVGEKLEELDVVEAHGATHALRIVATGHEQAENTRLVAIPESNWTELTPVTKTTTTISFLEPDGSVSLEPAGVESAPAAEGAAS